MYPLLIVEKIEPVQGKLWLYSHTWYMADNLGNGFSVCLEAGDFATFSLEDAWAGIRMAHAKETIMGQFLKVWDIDGAMQ